VPDGCLPAVLPGGDGDRELLDGVRRHAKQPRSLRLVHDRMCAEPDVRCEFV
jgi:hypothetical protein